MIQPLTKTTLWTARISANANKKNVGRQQETKNYLRDGIMIFLHPLKEGMLR